MEYIIRVIEGPDAGAEAKLPPGQTIIGRSTSAGLRLSSPEISWEHLIITRNGDEYSVENLSARGTYADGNKITGQVRMRPPEQFRLSSDTVIRVESPGATAAAAMRTRLIILAVLSLSIVGVAVFFAGGSRDATPTVDNWDRAYNLVLPWMEREVRANRLPAEMPAVFREAWRHDQAGAFAKAQDWWLRLQLILDSVEDRRKLKAQAAENPRALQRLLTPRRDDPDPNDDELASATVQFVNRRLSWCVLQIKSSSGFFK